MRELDHRFAIVCQLLCGPDRENCNGMWAGSRLITWDRSRDLYVGCVKTFKCVYARMGDFCVGKTVKRMCGLDRDS